MRCLNLRSKNKREREREILTVSKTEHQPQFLDYLVYSDLYHQIYSHGYIAMVTYAANITSSRAS